MYIQSFVPKTSLVHTSLCSWSSKSLDRLAQWYSSLLTLRVQNLEMKLPPQSSLCIVLGHGAQVSVNILKAGPLAGLGQPGNILKPLSPLLFAQKMDVW